jgi:hypothetical protein
MEEAAASPDPLGSTYGHLADRSVNPIVQPTSRTMND